ncbi:MAG TPA: hypothetical protein VGL38_15070 [bacterium]
MQTITKLIQIFKSPPTIILLSFLLVEVFNHSAAAQPGPLQSYDVQIQAGNLTVPRYTPFAMSYYPYYNGQRNDSVTYSIGNQITSGGVATADRIIDVTVGGTYAYRDTTGRWAGFLVSLRNGRGFLYMNRHEARTVTLEGFPFDTVTYILPMPRENTRIVAARMNGNHPINRVGLTASGFHWSQNMRQGGDIILDLTTRQIARRDSTSGWIGTLDSMRVGHPVLIQVNYPATFDWTYNPTRE